MKRRKHKKLGSSTTWTQIERHIELIGLVDGQCAFCKVKKSSIQVMVVPFGILYC